MKQKDLQRAEFLMMPDYFLRGCCRMYRKKELLVSKWISIIMQIIYDYFIPGYDYAIVNYIDRYLY